MTMVMFSPEWISALVGIIVIDSMLIANNAMLVGMTIGKLPAEMHTKASFTVAGIAMVLTTAMAVASGWAVANVPYFMAIAGLALVAVGLHTAYVAHKSLSVK
jgi:predicted tellurium resistance membrane protein TerC